MKKFTLLLLNALLLTSITINAAPERKVVFVSGSQEVIDYRSNGYISKDYEFDSDKIWGVGFCADSHPGAPLKFGFYTSNGTPILEMTEASNMNGASFEVQNIRKTSDGTYICDLFAEFLYWSGSTKLKLLSDPNPLNIIPGNYTNSNCFFRKDVNIGKSPKIKVTFEGSGFASAQGNATLYQKKKVLKGTIGSYDNNDKSVKSVKPGDKVKIRWDAYYE
jgi:hypothetical protein